MGKSQVVYKETLPIQLAFTDQNSSKSLGGNTFTLTPEVLVEEYMYS